MSSEPSCKFEEGPPPISWDEYSRVAVTEYHRLLQTSPDEAALQSFLEMNPSFVPGASSHAGICDDPDAGTFPYALITQPELSGATERKPDFMWFTGDSHFVHSVWIEIERPDRHIFRKNAVQPTAEFTHAKNQLAEWRSWLSIPANCHVFAERYGHQVVHYPPIVMYLVFGRRAEFEASPEKKRHRAHLVDGRTEILVSYDHLRPDPTAEHMFTVRSIGGGRYRAVAIPPTFRWSAYLALRLPQIDGMIDAINRSPLISEQRRKFLIDRYGYWMDWALNRFNNVLPLGRE